MSSTKRKRNVFRLHVVTCAVGWVTAAGLTWQQYIIGPYYWSGFPLLVNCLYGVLILAATISVCEWRMRKKGYLVRFNWCTVIAMAIVSVGFVSLNFNPSQGTHGSFAYGFPETIYVYIDGSSADGGPAGGRWIIRNIWAVVVGEMLLVLAAALLAESFCNSMRKYRTTTPSF